MAKVQRHHEFLNRRIPKDWDWMNGAIPEKSLRIPVNYARSILRREYSSDPENSARNLCKVFFNTIDIATKEGSDVVESVNSLYERNPKEHFLAAFILAFVAYNQFNNAQIAYQKLTLLDKEQDNDKFIEFMRKHIESMPSVKEHIIHKYAQRTGGVGGEISSNLKMDNFWKVCEMADTLFQEDYKNNCRKKGYNAEIIRRLAKVNSTRRGPYIKSIPSPNAVNDYLCVWNKANKSILGDMSLINMGQRKYDELVEILNKSQKANQDK